MAVFAGGLSFLGRGVVKKTKLELIKTPSLLDVNPHELQRSELIEIIKELYDRTVALEADLKRLGSGGKKGNSVPGKDTPKA